MKADAHPASRQKGVRESFTPKLVSVLREGYDRSHMRADVIAGLTVAIVALPLSMALAIASGLGPERGLFAAIVGGFIVSALGGSRFQIGGPAGAFIVLVAATVERHGVDGMLLATLMAGVFLLIIGWLRIGHYIKLIPYPVTIGFTSGIAVIIMASQLRDLFGLTLDGREPGAFVPKIETLWAAAGTVNGAAVAVAFFTIGLILGVRRLRPKWPAFLIAVAAASLAAALLALPVETIGTRFGGIPRALPIPALPAFSIDLAWAVLPDAIAFALLGAIESLLSAVVADGMTGRRHRSSCELVAQGFANVGAALFGAMPVTGTLARTATNIRAGAHGPVSGMLHALFLLGFMLLAAPLASYIPLAALAGLLAVVAWNMVEKEAISALLRSSRGDAAVLIITFLLVIFRDLTEGIVVGFLLGSVLFIQRMAGLTSVETEAQTGEVPDEAQQSDPDVVVYRISGAFFFGAASTVGAVLDRIGDRRKALVLDCSAVPFLDSTAANVIEGAVRKAEHNGVKVFISGASRAVRRMLFAHEVRPPHVRYKATIAGAVAQARREMRKSGETV